MDKMGVAAQFYFLCFPFFVVCDCQDVVATARVVLIENVAAVQFKNASFAGIIAGNPFTITWEDASGAVTLTLMNGGPADLTTVNVIASM